MPTCLSGPGQRCAAERAGRTGVNRGQFKRIRGEIYLKSLKYSYLKENMSDCEGFYSHLPLQQLAQPPQLAWNRPVVRPNRAEIKPPSLAGEKSGLGASNRLPGRHQGGKEEGRLERAGVERVE